MNELIRLRHHSFGDLFNRFFKKKTGFVFAVLVASLEFTSFGEKKYTVSDRFRGNGQYGNIPAD